MSDENSRPDSNNLRDECLTKTVDLIVKADMSIGATETARTNEKCILAVALVYGYPTDLREFAAAQAVVAPMTRDLIHVEKSVACDGTRWCSCVRSDSRCSETRTLGQSGGAGSRKLNFELSHWHHRRITRPRHAPE